MERFPLIQKEWTKLKTNFGEANWWLADRLIKVGIKNFEYLEEVNNHLLAGGRLIVIHNHPGTPDPLITLKIVQTYLPDFTKIGYFGSSKFFDGRIMSLGLMDYLTNRANTDLWQVLQPNDKEGLKRLEKRNEKREEHKTPEFINSVAARKGKTLLRRVPGSVLLVCPQGTREPRMLEPNEHIFEILKKEELENPHQIKVLPLTINGSEKLLSKQRIFPNFDAQVRVDILPMMTYDDILHTAEVLEIPPSHAMMINIATHVPYYYWGVHEGTITKMTRETGITDPKLALEFLMNRPTNKE